MALTRSQVEKILIRRAKVRMEFVGFAVTDTGDNNDLADPISATLLGMGITPADITDPDDSDLSGVSEVNEFLDRCELRLLENIIGNLDTVDISVGPRSESLGQFAIQLEKIISQKTKKISDLYGGDAQLQSGVLVQNIAQKGNSENVYYAD